MAFNKILFFILLFCATVSVGVSAYAKTTNAGNSSVRLGVFNSQEAAQSFFETLPSQLQSIISDDQLWLNAYQSQSGFTEHHLEITKLTTQTSTILCKYAATKNTQCLVTTKTKFRSSKTPRAPINITPSAPITQIRSDLPHMLHPLGLSLQSPTDERFEGLSLELANTDRFGANNDQALMNFYSVDFSLDPQIIDTAESRAVKAAYDTARNSFITALENVGNGINAGQGDEALKENLMTLGQKAFEAAGSVYLANYLKETFGQAEALSNEAGSGATFIHHIKKNLGNNAKSTVNSVIEATLSGATSGNGLQNNFIKNTTDSFMLSGARNLIDAGIVAAKRSDLYALRHLELEYNLNNFEDSYLSVLATQPIYQSTSLRHNAFLQGGGIINEHSVDIDDDTSRHTLNIGAAYRYLTVDEKYLLGGNVFFDHQWPYNHSRMSVGLDAKAQNVNLAANYYHPLSGFKDSRRDANGNEYEERALKGYDIELGYQFPFMPDLSIFSKGYQYFSTVDENKDIRGLELSTEYNINDHFTVKGTFIEENGGRDGVELALQYRMPLYNRSKPNLALADMEPAAGSASMRSKIFEKVRRENRIRVEERLKNSAAAIITAQFNALSVGLPFDVGGIGTGALINLPFNTAITVPNGDFGIINFSNGAIANISASGVGDVILEFNATTLTVTATNGGFVQFITGSGGISTVNVPGGTVNLLGTDIDVTDNGVTTTIQVRAGLINVVPDVGVAALGGNQGEVVSLTIASGATSLLVNPALETRQEAAYTNLDLINPDPPSTEKSAPFINVAPALITGPQFIGNNADIRLTFSQPVAVTGAPFINALVGINARTFTYNAGASTPTQPVFRYTYIAADVGAASLTITDLDLNGGTIISTTNTLNAVTAFTNTIVAINDLTPPSLTSSTPIDNEPLFSAGGNITLNFDENIQAGIGNIILTDTTDGSDTRIIPIGDAQVIIAGSTLTINLTGTLDLTTDYDLIIASGVIRDTTGNAFPGIASGGLNFTTSNGTVALFTGITPPANMLYTTGQNLDWTLTYDQTVTVAGGTPSINLTLDSGAAQASFAGGSGTANLLFRYTILSADLDANGVVLANTISLNGATMLDTTSLTQNASTDFTAINVATPLVLIDQPPVLTGSTPTDNATGQSVGTDITLTFNKNIQAGAGNIVFTDTDDGSGNFTISIGDARVNIATNTLTIDLSAQLLEFNTNYEITTASGVIENLNSQPHPGFASGDINWQTIADPTAGFPAATASVAPNSTAAAFTPRNTTSSWQTTINVGATPNGVIFESGGTGRGIAAWFHLTDLLFAAGNGATVATGGGSIFGAIPIASIPQGLHHFVFVAKPTAGNAQLAIYMDGIKLVDEQTAAAMTSNEWAGTSGVGYGLQNSIRNGGNSNPITGATLTNSLTFYLTQQPPDF